VTTKIATLLSKYETLLGRKNYNQNGHASLVAWKSLEHEAQLHNAWLFFDQIVTCSSARTSKYSSIKYRKQFLMPSDPRKCINRKFRMIILPMLPTYGIGVFKLLGVAVPTVTVRVENVSQTKETPPSQQQSLVNQMWELTSVFFICEKSITLFCAAS